MAAAPTSPVDPKHANIVYHDWEAATYDDKWSISFDDRCIDYAAGRFAKALGGRTRRFERVLEIGCGTGFFLLNLAQAGYIGEAHACDISQGMVDTCVRNGARLGIDVHGRQADAEALPYPDGSFDAVIGHAVVHHLPDLDAAFAEIHRVLAPGGVLVVAGEPTLLGDAIANQFKRATRLAVRTAAAVLGRERVLREPAHASPEDAAAAALEAHVDQHIFTPRELHALATRAGFEQVRTQTEELTANWWGWIARTGEAMLRDEWFPTWAKLASYRTWRTLFALDEAVLARIVPADVFYNCILSATKADRAPW